MSRQSMFDPYIGKTEHRVDSFDLRQVRFMQSLISGKAPLDTGDSLPPLWHWLYFHVALPISKIAEDGHPVKGQGQFLPPIELEQRLWAGGRLDYSDRFYVGDEIRRESTISNICFKKGKSGELCFVTVDHVYSRGEQVILREGQDIVYKNRANAAKGQTTQRPIQQQADISESWLPDAVTLFRYSALTFNGHRIHYDIDYCREVENYPSLVVHGPLTATMLADLGQRNNCASLASFHYRGLAPLFCATPVLLNQCSGDESTTLWATGGDKNILVMEAEAQFS